MNEAVKGLVYIGFCQPKFYKRTVWNYAKKMMKIACQEGLAMPHDFGRGKGKYLTDYKIDEVALKLSKNKTALDIAEKFKNYTNRTKSA